MPEQEPLAKLSSSQFGTDLLRGLYSLIQTAKIHEDNNQLIKRCLIQLKAIFESPSCPDEIEIQLWRGRFHVCGERVPHTRDMAGVIDGMAEHLDQRKINGIWCCPRNILDSPESLLSFVRLMNNSVRDEDPPGYLEKNLIEQQLTWANIYRKPDEDSAIKPDASLEERRYERTRNVYVHAIETVKEVADRASKGIVGVRKARRVAQNIVDLVKEDTSLMLGLAAIKDYDDYTYAHSVNVALIATCLAKTIKMPDTALEHVSVCGLFHDLGKVGVSKEVLLKKGTLNDAEWEEMRSHPIIGVRKILKLNAPRGLRSRIILGPFEHHLNPDLTGYPRTFFMIGLSIVGRILRIADVYEALTSSRAYRPRAFTPDEALRKMWSGSGKSFDPILLKRFIHMMGIYPIGSVVVLSDNSYALVLDYPDEMQRELPLIMRLVEDGQGGYQRGDTIYLPDHVPPVAIVKSIDPSLLDINPAQFFLREK